MSLYGALFSGVSGLKSQSSKLASISDNISNVNTVGYKGNLGIFQTLVTSSASGGGAYSPGGVIGSNRQLISQQGLLQATNSPTDIAIAGAGFFVVNQTSDSNGQVFYTRAGSFTQDSTGNFRNASGFFLQAWPLDREGRLPGEPGNSNTISSANLGSLRTVNVQNLTGVAASTSTVTLSANLKATESIFPGASATATMNDDDSVNFNNDAADIIIPQGSGLDSLAKLDAMTITIGSGSFTYTYGGYTVGRSVSTGADGEHGSAVLGATSDGEFTIASGDLSVGNSSNVVTVDFGGAHGLETGDVIEITGPTGGVGTIPATDLTGTFVVTKTGTDTVTIVVATTTGGAGAAVSTNAAAVDIRPFDDTGEILDANAADENLLGATTTTPFASAALSFTISSPVISGGSATFRYASPASAAAGTFTSLNNLVAAINAVDGLTARISGGKLYVSAVDATQALTFTNGLATGTEGDSTNEALYGIDWVREFGLANVAANSGRFSTLQGLSDLVNATTGLSGTIDSPLSDSSLTINVDDPLDTITFSDDSGNTGSLLAALGLVDSLDGAAFTAQTTGALGPAYDAAVSTKSMSGGAITPQFSRLVRIFDPLGEGHDLSISFIKTGINTWAVEIYAVNETDVTTVDGLLASGSITFNGDSTLRSVSASLVQEIEIAWSNGASDSAVTFNWGTAGIIGVGQGDGLTQFASAYKVNFANQNGAQVGELTAVSIDDEGFVTASYSNGETQRLFRVPLADFANPDALQASSGNVYSQSSGSGEVNLALAGASGVGKVASSSLEASNVELADQLTDMIVAQRAYQANTKIITTAAALLEELNNSLRS